MRGAGWSVLTVVLLALAAPWAVAAAPPGAEDFITRPDWVADEVLVKFREGTPEATIDRVRQGVAARELRSLGSTGVRQWQLDRGVGLGRALAALARPEHAAFIEYAEPNVYFHTNAWPSDPMRVDLWGLHNIGQPGGVRDADIDALDAWNVATGSGDVVVAVIDGGVDYNHPDLAANIWSNPGEIPGNGVDDDLNGYVDDVRGWNFVANSNDPIDDAGGHGTHVAGTIGGTGNNGIGVTGVAWQVRILPLKFLDSSGFGTAANAILAIQYASSLGVRILNNSWSGATRSRALEDAIASSRALAVCAAGNDGNSKAQYPAASDLANIVSVAATDRNDQLAAFSSRSSSWVDLGAPGVDIYSTRPDSAYGLLSGTSMAAPHVSGTAALLLALHPGWGANEMKAALLGTVDPLTSLAGKTVTGGRLNAARALGVTPIPDTDITPPGPVIDLATSGQPGCETITLTWHAAADDAGGATPAWGYDLRYAKTPLDESTWSTATAAVGEPAPGAPGQAEIFTLPRLSPETTYWFGLKVVDESGNLSPLSNVLVAATPRPASPWVVESLPEPSGSWSLAFDAVGQPAIGSANSAIKLHLRTEGGWQTGIVDPQDGNHVRLAFDPIDHRPSLAYLQDGRLKFAHWNGSAWSIETVEARNAGGALIGLAYDPTGRPAVAYQYTGRNGGLRFALRTGGTWGIETVSPAPAQYCSLAFGPDGNAAISFSDSVSGGVYDTLRLARKQGTTWRIDTIETGVRGFGVWNDLAFDASGYPAMVHRGSGTGDVRFAFWDGAKWAVEAVYAATSLPGYPSLVFDGSGMAHVAFFTGSSMSGGYNCAGHRSAPGRWDIEIIEPAQSPGGPIDFAIDPQGRLATAYYNPVYSALRYAVRQPTP